MDCERRNRPNILVIVSDTHTAAVTGCYGSPIAHTPNLDRLAAEGVVFTSAYCQNPLCVPSRQSMITGKRSFQTGVIHNDMPMPELRTIGHVLKEQEYDTAAIGKMHFIPDAESSAGKERHYGFDWRLDYEEFYDYLRRERGAPPLSNQPDDPWRIVHLEKWVHRVQTPLVSSQAQESSGNFPWGTLAFEDHQEALVLREWRRFLKERRDRPFLAFVSFQGPHSPYLPTPEFLDLCRSAPIPLPPPPEENILSHPILSPRGKSAEKEKQEAYLRHYCAFVRFTDHCVGQALRDLEAAGGARNTLVAYVSDHGDMLYEHGLTGKMVFYENSVRVPLIIRWPGQIEGGWRYEGLVELLDLFSTWREAAGASASEAEEGRSLLPDLLKKRDDGKPAVFSESYPMERNRRRFGDWPHRLVRTREWKLIQYGPEREDLFCLADDPGETRNLISEPRFTAQAAGLRRMLLERLGPLPQPEERLCSGYYKQAAR